MSPPTMTTNIALSNNANNAPSAAGTLAATPTSSSTCVSATASAGTGGGQGSTKHHCLRLQAIRQVMNVSHHSKQQQLLQEQEGNGKDAFMYSIPKFEPIRY